MAICGRGWRSGARVWKTGAVMRHDVFAFTPTLPEWIDHEWGAGVVFFALLNWFGPASLMIFKIGDSSRRDGGVLGGGAIERDAWACVILLLAMPCAVAILPGYVPVVRSHALTFLFFGVTLLCLELIRGDAVGPRS